MAVLYICGFSGDLPVIPCSDENIGHFERRNAYPFKFTCNSTGCSGVVVDCGSSHTFRRQSNFFIYGSGVRVVVSDTTNLIDGKTSFNFGFENCSCSISWPIGITSFFDILMYKLYQKFRMISIINYEL